jgi:hypothetical protein
LNDIERSTRVKKAATFVFLGLLIVPILNAQKPAFESKTTLVRPLNYREWIFVGSSRGLSYAQNPPATAPSNEMYHNVYITPEAYREFAKTGKFPEGSMLAMEMASSDTKREPGLQGSYEKIAPDLKADGPISDFQTGWVLRTKTRPSRFP